jgi:tRNA 2-selenouridine synthase
VPYRFTDLSGLRTAGFDAIIDVRSPSEFAEDHVPGAVSMPVLSDAERAEVGTIYVQDSPFKARKIGAALVARNAARHIEDRLMAEGGGWRPLVYCWRGGMRSRSFTFIPRFLSNFIISFSRDLFFIFAWGNARGGSLFIFFLFAHSTF